MKKPYRPKKKSKFTGDRKFNVEKSSRDPEDTTVRLNKYIADAGVCSRREADKLIDAGEITVNGAVIKEMGHRVEQTDTVKYNGRALKRERYIYILLNKPKDYITTSNDESGRKTVLDLISGACNERVYPVGRLDRNTTGLLVITNDGELTKRLTHPSYNITKKYLAEVEKGLDDEKLAALKSGVELEDGWSNFDNCEFGEGGHNKKKIKVEIHSGKNRIVRRMFEHVGHEVIKLDRFEFAGLKKGPLGRGKCRMLSSKEVGYLKMLSNVKAEDKRPSKENK
jgi:23S rRNA pseudouridine2605 synthase